MRGQEITQEAVLAVFGRDDALTVMEVADRVAGWESWPMRGTVRNRLYALADMQVLIESEERPRRFALNDLGSV